MKQILITPGSDADADWILKVIQKAMTEKRLDALHSGILRDSLIRCTAVALTDVPASPPGWEAVDTAPEPSLHVTTP